MIRGRPDADYVFLNRQGHPLTRYGIHAMVERHAKAVGQSTPSLKRKRVSQREMRRMVCQPVRWFLPTLRLLFSFRHTKCLPAVLPTTIFNRFWKRRK